MTDKRIRLATTNPDLKDKITTNIIGKLDTVYWYIKFNIPLDESTVSAKSMNVTDTKGFIMRTSIQYDDEKNTIVLSPLDTYSENVYYLLNISKKVKSAKGQALKNEIHILFKLMHNEISEYELLKSTVKAPKPLPRPRNYDDMMSKTYSFTNVAEKVSKNTLDYKDIDINILLSVLGIVLLGVSFYFNNLVLMGIAIFVCIVGIAHIIRQSSNNELMSNIQYNMGVRNFNKGKYAKAAKGFKKALQKDPNNEEAEYAMSKVKFYL